MNEGGLQSARFRHVVFPESARAFGRPLDLAPREPGRDSVVPPEPLTPDGEALLRRLSLCAGVNLGRYKPETLRRRLPACLRALRVSSPAQARSLLRRQPALTDAALDALLIGVTSFFRDDGVFTALRSAALPELVRRWRADPSGRPLRVWSAGCSSGAELYSVALLLLELGALWPQRSELLGTDCRAGAVARAAAGAFEPAELKGVPSALLREYFVCDGERFRVRTDVRSAVRFTTGDALSAPEPGPWDLVLCRNVAIYIRGGAADALWGALCRRLRPGGLLVVGKAERPLGMRGLRCVAPCLYRREGDGDE